MGELYPCIYKPWDCSFKKFKKHVLNQNEFTDRLCLLAIDEIYLVDEWGKQFKPLYAEIQKVQKQMFCHVSLLDVSATLTRKTRLVILQKTGFLPNYRLMQTLLDRPKIMQIYRFIEHSKGSCLDLQFILPKTAKEACDIPKTIIFVNIISDIRPIISIIQAWMKQLRYHESFMTWIRPYYSTMSDWDKNLTAEAFCISKDENLECTILIATDAYGMGIDNSDVKPVIQWDLPISFDSMIQRIGYVGRKAGYSYFIFLSPR